MAGPDGAPENQMTDAVPGVQVNGIKFAYQGCGTFIQNCNIALPRGSRCLLLGANGAGKTSLLQLLAGKYMVGKEEVLVLGRPPFHDLELTCTGQLSYLGTSWRRDVACAGYGVPLQGDISAGKMIFGVPGVPPARRAQLITLLDIDLNQRMTIMSDGQRRRVQICMGLLKPYDVLLLDEITVDLDVVGRAALLDFFIQECDERGCTIVYATHIFDGLEKWISHIAYMEDGQIVKGGTAPEVVPEVGVSGGAKLLTLVEKWLRSERDVRLAAPQKPKPAADAPPVARTGPFMGSKHMAYFH